MLSVLPESVRDRDGIPYEMTLLLRRDGEPFGVVGERCGFFLANLVGRLAQATSDAGPLASDGNTTVWGDPDDRFPPSSMEAGVRAWAVDTGLPADRTWSDMTRYLPRERSLFSFRRRDPDDPTQLAELRCSLRTSKSWLATDERGHGRWVLRERALLDAWGEAGVGIRAVLTAPELLDLLRRLLAEAGEIGIAYGDTGPIDLQRPVG